SVARQADTASDIAATAVITGTRMAADRTGPGEPGPPIGSALAHALGRHVTAAGAHLVDDACADLRIDRAPVVQRAAEHRTAHPAEQRSGDLIDQIVTFGLVHHLTHQPARLGDAVLVVAHPVGGTPPDH